MSKERAASTSVETLPGMISRILRAELEQEGGRGRVRPGVIEATALLLGLGDGSVDQRLAYSGFLEAARIERRVGGGILRLVLCPLVL